MTTSRLAIFGFLVAAIALTTPMARGQVLSGTWVKQSDKSIEKNRKTDIRILVLDATGQPAAHAAVHLDQQRQAFHIGLMAGDGLWPGVDMTRPAWRCFTAVSLAPITGWDQLQPDAEKPPRTGAINKALDAAARDHLHVRWGPLVSTDVGREPAWAASLKQNKLRPAAEKYMRWAVTQFGHRVPSFDLLTDTVDHLPGDRGFDVAHLRGCSNELKTIPPHPTLTIRYENGLMGSGMRPAFQQMVKMQQAFVPIDAVTLGRHFRDRVLHTQLSEALHQWDQFNGSLILSPIVVGGSDEATARINLETVLRTVFADPNVRGIYFACVTPGDTGDSHAQFVGQNGKPTPVGHLFDQMFHKLWRTDVTQRADALGNIRTRVFAGTYHLTARLTNGQTASTKVWIPMATGEQLIVLQVEGKGH